MENTELAAPPIDEAADLKTTLSRKYDSIIEKTYRIDEMYWDIEKEGMNSYLLKNVGELIELLYNELSALFACEEEIVFRELDSLMPGLASVTLLRNENSGILEMFSTMKNTIGSKSDIRKDKELLQAEMISAVDLIQRNVYKKENEFLNDLNMMLPEDKLSNMVLKIKMTM